jgi:small subunit ribosomal protein S6
VIAEKLAKHHGLLSLAEEATIDNWGRRQLAYQINKRDTGYYVVARFSAETTKLPEFERSLKLDDGVMRYLISLHEHELGAPPLTEEQLEAKRRAEEAGDDDDDED